MRKYTIETNNIKPVEEVLDYIHTKCNNQNITQVKEKIAEKILREHKIFEKICMLLGYEYQGYKKITTKALQKAGVDYVIWYNDDKEMYIDIKTGIGIDYSNGIALELTQYGTFTNRKDKKTTFDLYFLYDTYGIRVYLIQYKKINEVCWDIWKTRDQSTYTWYTSFNGTGEYIKYPPELIADVLFDIKEK